MGNPQPIDEANAIILGNLTALHGVFRSPLSCGAVVSSSVCFEELRNVWNQRIVGVGVGEKTTDGEQDLANGQRRTPLVLQNVQANSTVRVDVAMVNTSGKVNLWRLERIIRRKVDIEKEDSPGIRGLIWTHDRCLPMEHVISYRTSGTVCWRVFSQVDQF